MAHDKVQTGHAFPARRRWIAVLLIATAVAVTAPTLFRELRPRDLPGAGVLLATTAGNKSEDVDWILDHPVWGELVGDGEGAVSPEARAVRLGAAIADLELRYLRADSSALSSAAHVIQLLQTFPGSESAVHAFESLGPTADDATIRRASGAAERVTNPRLVRLGSWLRSARYAAASADSSVFDIESVRSVSQAAITYDARPETEFTVRQFEKIARQRPHDWTALATSVEELLRRLGAR
jgi:hypothetical protein